MRCDASYPLAAQGSYAPSQGVGLPLDNGVLGGYDGGMNNDATPLPLPMPRIYILSHNCTGPNPKCRAAGKNGRTVHMSMDWDAMRETLIPTTHHFESVEQGTEQLTREWNDAITIKTDNELYAARKAKIAHRLPIGWIDPGMRGNRVMTLHFER